MKRVLVLAVSFFSLALVGCTQKGPLKVDSVEPAQGIVSGGDEVTIKGGGFEPGKTQAEVRFGRQKAESVQIAASNKIKVLTPAGDKGPVDVTVMFDDGTVFKIQNGFRYQEPADGEAVRRAFLSGSKGGAASGAGKIEIEKK